VVCVYENLRIGCRLENNLSLLGQKYAPKIGVEMLIKDLGIAAA
jgi:hypothetical protein